MYYKLLYLILIIQNPPNSQIIHANGIKIESPTFQQDTRCSMNKFFSLRFEITLYGTENNQINQGSIPYIGDTDYPQEIELD